MYKGLQSLNEDRRKPIGSQWVENGSILNESTRNKAKRESHQAVQKRGGNTIRIYTDGASRGNPGESAWAFVAANGNKIVNRKAGFLGQATNNMVEYEAVINALEEATKWTTGQVEIYSDSKLLVRQINGQYRVKQPHLQGLCSSIQRLRSRFEKVRFINVPRDHRFIKQADRLCNECLDEYAARKETKQ